MIFQINLDLIGQIACQTEDHDVSMIVHVRSLNKILKR
jgi:hypothetical protein